MPDAHILVIDDEVRIRRLLRTSLLERGYRVTAVTTGNEGLDIITSDPPAVVLLDLGLPDLDGLDVAVKIRALSTVPIIVISARYDEAEKVQALDLGADDYLTKPFGTNELLARIRVALRHTQNREDPTTLISVGDLLIDTARRRITVQGSEIRLTRTEYALLLMLASNQGRVLTHQWLLEHVWGPGYEDNIQNLHVFISQIRRKIEPEPGRPRYILTDPGVGYRFCAIDAGAS